MIRGEYDGYKMPDPFKGELTQEQLEEKEKARLEGLALVEELRQKYNLSALSAAV